MGEGSKLEDSTKTGQYGVGFNCVYHLTDAPTFLTTMKSATVDQMNMEGTFDEDEAADINGTVLCIFDPNCKFLPDVSEDKPGAMYNKVEITPKTVP